MDLQEITERTLAGDKRALARLLTYIESGDPSGKSALAQLHKHCGRAHVIGITGSPGAGKSTLVSQLTLELRRRGNKIGVVAVDPSSPFTGGAILGDRIRMQELIGDPNIFIRSMASRGSVGGLSAATRDVVRALDAAGFTHIIIETVGAGQAEVEIVRAAHSIVVVMAPGMGDDIQALKAGILEIADIFCVNKADRPGADQTASELRALLTLDQRRKSGDWTPPVLKTTAATGEGVEKMADELAHHLSYLEQSGALQERRERQARSEILALLYQSMITHMNLTIGKERFGAIVGLVASMENDPYTAAAILAKELGIG